MGYIIYLCMCKLCLCKLNSIQLHIPEIMVKKRKNYFTPLKRGILKICIFLLIPLLGLQQAVMADENAAHDPFNFIDHLVVPIKDQNNFLAKTHTAIDDRGEFLVIKSHLYSNALAVIVLTHRWKLDGDSEHLNKAKGILRTLSKFQYQNDTPKVAGAFPNMLAAEDYHIDPGLTQPYCADGSSKMIRNGNNGWLLMALGYYTLETGDRSYVPQLEALADYLSSEYAQNKVVGSPTEGAIYTGWGSNFEAVDSHKSYIVTEHQCQAFSGLLYAAEIIGQEPVGALKAQYYIECAQKILKFTLAKLYNPNNPRPGIDTETTCFHPGISPAGQLTDEATSLDAQTWTNLAFGRILLGIEDISGALDYAWAHLYAGDVSKNSETLILNRNHNRMASTVDPCAIATTIEPTVGIDQVFGVSNTHSPAVGYGALWFEGDQGIWLSGTAQLAYAYDYNYYHLNGDVTDQARGEHVFKNMSAMEWQADTVTVNTRTYSWPRGGFQVFSDGYTANSEQHDCLRSEAYPNIEPSAWRYFDLYDLNPYAVQFSAAVAAQINFPIIQTKLLADDGGANDFFGSSVTLNKTIAIVGVPGDDDYGRNAGAAYLIDSVDQKVIAKLFAGDGAERDRFGHKVANDGNRVVITAIGGRNGSIRTGAAYVFDLETGAVLQKLVPDDGHQRSLFGSSAAINGNIAVIGAMHESQQGYKSGAAYIFDVHTGKQLHKLLPEVGAAGDAFGCSVALNDTVVIVGAPRQNRGSSDSGAVHVFDVNTGKQLYTLVPDTSTRNDQFGASIAIDGTKVLVGAHKDKHNGRNAGAAYLFDLISGKQIFKLSASDSHKNDQFGCSVALQGDTAVIGAKLDDDQGENSGSIYIFDMNTGLEIEKIIPGDASSNSLFGHSIAIEDDQVIVGAPFNADNGSKAGSVYIYDLW